MQKFPWTQFLTSLIFYVIIAGLLYALSTLLPAPAPRAVSPDDVQTQQAQQTQAVYQQVLTAVGRHMVLPSTTPEISVINDLPTFLAQNPQFAGASVGDVVLLYSDRVIVYSPTADRIINTVMLSADQAAIQQNPAVSAGTESQQTVTVPNQ